MKTLDELVSEYRKVRRMLSEARAQDGQLASVVRQLIEKRGHLRADIERRLSNGERPTIEHWPLTPWDK